MVDILAPEDGSTYIYIYYFILYTYIPVYIHTIIYIYIINHITLSYRRFISFYIDIIIHIHFDTYMYIYIYYTAIYREYSGVGTFQISIDQGVRRGLGSQCPSWRRYGMGLMHHG